MKKIIFLSITSFYFFMTSCDLLNSNSAGLTSDEIVNGLKTALTAGTDTSATALNKQNGYFGDAAVKILLPPEAQPILNYISAHPLIQAILQPKVDQVILSINRAAEDAASKAKPIFVGAVSNMTISDGLNILNGTTPGVVGFDSTAATVYLKVHTEADLTAAFSPYLDESLNKPLVGTMSTNQIWADLTQAYNIFVPANQQITGTLGTYATQKALDGIFLKVGNEEKKIRKNPYQWASDIIQKVFGYVYKG